MRNRRRLKSFCRGTAHIPDFHRFFGLRASYSKNDVLQKFKHFTAKNRVFCVKNPIFCKILEKSSISLKTERTASNYPLKTGKYRQKRLHSLQNYHTSDLQTGWTDKISGNQSKKCKIIKKRTKRQKTAHFYKISCIFSKSTGFSANIKRPKSHCIGMPNRAKKAENNASEPSSKHQTGNCSLTAQQRASNTA